MEGPEDGQCYMSLATTDLTSTSPQIGSHPHGVEERLIDNGMLHYEASLAGFAERYSRGETSHTIHVWWARRPHSAMRALVFASLCKDTSPSALNVLKRLTLSDDEEVLEEARQIISKRYKDAPRFLDMFGGGGTIPMEAANLGAETYSLDANQLSVFIQRCNLVDSQNASRKTLKDLLRDSGQRVLSRLAQETNHLFPLRRRGLSNADEESPFGYIWTYTILCKQCGYKFYLSKRQFLSKKNGKSIAFVTREGKCEQHIELQDNNKIAAVAVWNGRTGTAMCPKCCKKTEKVSVADCEDALIALIKPAKPSGKQFLEVVDGAVPGVEVIRATEQAALNALNAMLPASELPAWSGIVNPAIYGITTHADFLNPRQRAVLLLLIKVLHEEYAHLRLYTDEATCRYVIGSLSSLVDQLIDWNCRLSMWIPQNEQVGRAFCGPGVSMLWDYVETDPVLNGPANLWSKLNRILAGVRSIKQYPRLPYVTQGYAQDLPFEDNFFDAIVTDPPYYDNIYYNVLADFFYSWKRLLLHTIAPDLFSTPTTDSKRELVASKFRSKTAAQAHEDYCEQLSLALCEAARVLKPDGVFSFVYSHSSLRGWEAIVRAYRATAFRITSVQPLSIERKQRPRAMTSEAINTCITFVAHKAAAKRSVLSMTEIQQNFEECADVLIQQLLAVNWNEADTALAVFANGVAMLANVEAVSGNDDVTVMKAMEQIVQKRIPSFRVQDRKSL